MEHGFFKAAAATPPLRLADCAYNAEQMIALLDEAQHQGVHILVFPELCLTGYSCGDLFLQDTLLSGAQAQLSRILQHSAGIKMLVFVGLPVQKDGKLYNCAAAIFDGQLLALIPKSALPNYAEFYELRHFAPAPAENSSVILCGQSVPFGTKLLLDCPGTALCVGAEICEDLWTVCPPSAAHALAGATVLVNLSASDEAIGKAEYRRQLVSSHAARCMAAYIYASAGEGESTSDMVFSGHNLIAENGVILAESAPFSAKRLVITEIDTARLTYERQRNSSFSPNSGGYQHIAFQLPVTQTPLTRYVDPAPFVPADQGDRAARCEAILTIQSTGLKRRLAHTGAKCAVIGISGGLDSTLALLVTARAMDLLGRPRSDILAVTMPCFGTTARTKGNAESLCERLGASLRCIDIKAAVDQHFRDIGQDGQNYDVTYENSQARERTQVLMDLANQQGGIVVGTGDLSELALGWATYNGDHMSMYGVNASVPKTLVRHIVRYYADSCGDEKLSAVLLDILDTPVSPELLPAVDGEISQKTEDLVGPYTLHDFYLYNMVRCGYSPQKIFRLACHAFQGAYDRDTIYKWLRTFCRRFFAVIGLFCTEQNVFAVSLNIQINVRAVVYAAVLVF